MSTHIIPGVTLENDDSLVLATMEQEGILGTWNKMKEDPMFKEDDRIMVYVPQNREEQWIVVESTGVPGDEGLQLWKIKMSVLKTSRVQRMLAYIEKARGVTKYSKIKSFKTNVPSAHRN